MYILANPPDPTAHTTGAIKFASQHTRCPGASNCLHRHDYLQDISFGSFCGGCFDHMTAD